MSFKSTEIAGRQRYPRRLIRMDAAVEVLLDVAIDMLNECDELRNLQEPPNPANISTWMGFISDKIWQSIPLPDFDIQARIEKVMPEWSEDWKNKGWLDEDDNRSIASPCNVNPYCWTGFAWAVMICLGDAIRELEEACYPKDNGKPRKWGPVSSRRRGNNFPRQPGRPSKSPPIGTGSTPQRGPGRPKKPKTIKYRGGYKGYFDNTRHAGFTGQRGRPKGAKDGYNSKRQKNKRLKRRIAAGDRSVDPNNLNP